jgi:uracil-DNA glycosylase family 4
MAQGHKRITQLIETEPSPRIPVNSQSPRFSSLSRLQSEIASCRLCPSMSQWRQFGLDAYGTRCSGYLLVGEAPGYKSWKQRRRFTGPAGLLIRRALCQVAHPRYRSLEDLFYMTDVVKCHPASGSTSISNRSPRRCEVQICIGYLSREIHLLRPSTIVTFGKTAAEAVAQVSDPSQAQATHAPPYKVIAFPHPSPRNQLTIRKHYASMKAFEEAICTTFCDLIAQLEQRFTHA